MCLRECPIKTNKEKNDETHETRRQEPVGIPRRLRTLRQSDSRGPGQVPVRNQGGVPQAQNRERQGIRMLEQSLRALRRLPAAHHDRDQGRPAQEHAGMLRVVPQLPRGGLPPPHEVPVRLQRMRTRAALPPPQEVLPRRRRTGELRGDAPHCPLRKKYYRAAGAQANYEGTLHASRLGVHVDAKTSQTCTRIFNMLWESAGPQLFRKLFAAPRRSPTSSASTST